MLSLFSRLVREEEGQGLVEYGLIIALIAIGLFVALGLLKDSLATLFEDVSKKLDERPPAGGTGGGD